MSFGSWSMVVVQFVSVLFLLSTGVIQAGAVPPGRNVPRVCIADGCLRGSWMRSAGGERYEAFLGVPFAKPPVGELRFADPVPNEPWGESELDASGRVSRSPCLQLNLFIPGRGIEGSEDCLYLNVYRSLVATNASAGAPLPTLVYIHGGGFLAGYASPLANGAERLMDHPAVLVTTAYRLGALGFLSTGDEAASGNFGLKDQRLALRWVQRNIGAFGGDPRAVTIMGHSAGGASVQLQMMHRPNEGLFQRAISLSGNALAAWCTPTSNPERLARRQATLVGIERTEAMSTRELVSALRAVEAEQFVSSFAGFTNGSRYPMIVYGPTVEKATVMNAFLTELPMELWSAGKYLQVPWLTGLLPNDGFVFSVPVLTESGGCSEDMSAQQQTLLLSMLRGTEHPNAFPMLRERFFGNASAGECFSNANINILTKIFNEALFAYPLTVSVRQHYQATGNPAAPIYLYRFNYRGQHSYSNIFVSADDEDDTQPRDFGIVHCDELIYIFRSPLLFPDFRRGSADAKASFGFTKFLLAFARSGFVEPQGTGDERPESDTSADIDFPPALEFFNTKNEQDPLGRKHTTIYDSDMVGFWTRFYGL